MISLLIFVVLGNNQKKIEGAILLLQTLQINITEENNDAVQELVLYLHMIGAVEQNDAREFFVKAEKLKGITYI
jgi:hypothetical protein